MRDERGGREPRELQRQLDPQGGDDPQETERKRHREDPERTRGQANHSIGVVPEGDGGSDRWVVVLDGMDGAESNGKLSDAQRAELDRLIGEVEQHYFAPATNGHNPDLRRIAERWLFAAD